MGRLSAIFVALCMILIAGALGVVLYLRFGLSGSESAITTLIALTGLAFFNAVTTRQRDRDDVERQLSDLSGLAAEVSRQLAELGRRVFAMEGKTLAAVESTLAVTQTSNAEIGEVGGLIKQIAEAVAAHDTQLRVLTPSAGSIVSAPPSDAPAARAQPPVPPALTEDTAPTEVTPAAPAESLTADFRSPERKAADVAAAEPKLSETRPFELRPPEPKPAEHEPAEHKPAAVTPPEAKPFDSKPFESKSFESTPTEGRSSDAKPVDAKSFDFFKPVEATPVEMQVAPATAAESVLSAPRPAVTPSADSRSVEAKSETKPFETKPFESKPFESKPLDAKPLDAKPVEARSYEPRSYEPRLAEPASARSRFKDMDPAAVTQMIREAVDGNRVDLFLQPIVTLPQRKVRYYEAVARLRAGDGEQLMAADFLPYAESGGLMPKIDNLMLFRCVQVVRRLLAKNREIGLFCNISTSTLIDSATFQQFTEFMEANKAIAPALVFEFTQSALRAMGPIENESLAALAQLGYRFSLDNVTDLRIEPRDLAERGFRFVKVQASLLLNRAGAAVTDIHPQDFAGLLSRFGVELVAAKIESESAVVDLLDYDVKFGQGFLFSPPRPVRPEVMQSLGNDLAPREGYAPVPPASATGGTPPVTVRLSSLAQLARGAVARN